MRRWRRGRQAVRGQTALLRWRMRAWVRRQERALLVVWWPLLRWELRLRRCAPKVLVEMAWVSVEERDDEGV